MHGIGDHSSTPATVGTAGSVKVFGPAVCMGDTGRVHIYSPVQTAPSCGDDVTFIRKCFNLSDEDACTVPLGWQAPGFRPSNNEGPAIYFQLGMVFDLACRWWYSYASAALVFPGDRD